MTGVRVLVGTRKGAFVLTSDGRRDRWEVGGPHFAGWEIYHVKGSPADPDRLYASQSSGWFGQVIQRSDDGGKTWAPAGNKFVYDGDPGTHQWYDGTQHPWEFERVWHLEPSLDDPGHGLCRGRGRRPVPLGRRRAELAGAARAARPRVGPVLAAGRRRDVPAHDPARSEPPRADVRRDLGGGRVPVRRRRADAGGRSTAACTPSTSPTPTPRSGTACTASRCTRRGRSVLFMQKHWDVMRSDDAGDSWREVSGNLPTDFGFPIDVHAHEPETIYVVPIKSDSRALPARGEAARLPQPDGRRRLGGAHERPAAAATATSTCCATRWPWTRSTPAACTSAPPAARSTPPPTPATPGRRSSATFPAVLSVEVQTLP